MLERSPTHANLTAGTGFRSEAGVSAVLVAGLHAVALAVLALHLYVRTLPPTPTAIPAAESAEAAWWGLWPATYAPAWAVWVGALAVVISAAAYWLPPARTQRPAVPALPWAALALLSALLVVAFFIFPVAHTRWGDAYVLSQAIAWPDPALRLTHSWQAPLDVFLHSRVWLWLGAPLGWENAAPVYRLLSPLAGALYLGALLALCRHRLLAPALTYGLFVTLGLVQLFFGYVENYSFAAAGVLLYLWLGLGVLSGARPLWPAALALAVTNATHPSTVALAPSLLALGWYTGRSGGRAQNGRNPGLLSIVLQIGLPVLVVSGATLLLMEAGGHGLAALRTTDRPGGGDARWFVPLWETSTRWEHYTLGSRAHLRDLFNQQMLTAPVVLPALAWVGVWALWARRSAQAALAFGAARPALVFAGAAAAFYLLFAAVWNPDYGGQRDWDLFSLAALPVTLLLALALSRALPTGRRWAVAPLLLVQGLHTAAWIFQNTRPWEWP